MRFPLYAKILLWFFLNLVLLVGGVWLFARAQIHLGLDSIIAGSASERVQAVADVMAAELKEAKREEWSAVLDRFSQAYRLQFYLFRADGAQVGGESVTLPAAVGEKVRDPRTLGGRRPGENFPSQGKPLPDPRRGNFRPEDNRAEPGQPGGPRPDEKFRADGAPRSEARPRNEPPSNNPRPQNRPPGTVPPPGGSGEGEGFRPGGPFGGDGSPRPEQRMGDGARGGAEPRFGGGTRSFGPPTVPSAKFMVRAGEPELYWVGVRLQVGDRDAARPLPLTLLAASESFAGGGLFMDFTPWIVLGAGALMVSVLFWLPLVRGITRSVSQMTVATERIAEGNFDARVAAARSDELGSLASAINRMAARLAGFVTGQKRFTGDIAHELCAPIARIQMALGILEQRADEKQKAYVDDLREEVQHMSSLVNELLSFSKAGLRQKELQLEAVELAPLIQRVVARETAAGGEVRVEIPAEHKALAEPELLARAVANLVRNALRHAGAAGPIVVSAAGENGRVTLSVADSGPGVPEESLQQIFDPFFRLDASRTRDTGGAGLGLAIVKTCVEACQGTVTAHNRQPAGLQVDIVLRAAG
ncbi:MAG: HAMP domain-containing protein [Verrucomicrobia bacterium]|nr:HAMP domain-containing protein [Verrucomicrobiota bacterium]